jgi:WD40 repeat protein
MSAGGRKVGQVLFHPTASNVLASASGDHVIRLWDIEKPEEPVIVLEAHGDTIQDMVSELARSSELFLLLVRVALYMAYLLDSFVSSLTGLEPGRYSSRYRSYSILSP